MATQAAMIADTIANMKRAIRRENDSSGSDDLITQPTNRGYKLKRHAKYVQEGALANTNGPELYKQKIEHAGYSRYILQRNPRRYDEDGEELEDDDVDEEADAAAAEENPYGGIHLEDLLCQLKHPSELPKHPSMSFAYTSNALPKMIDSAYDKLRLERANLWRAKNLYRQFVGDESWIPCAVVETEEDWDIFEPRRSNVVQETSKKRKRDESAHSVAQNQALPQPLGEAVLTGSANVSELELNRLQPAITNEQATTEDVDMVDVPREGDNTKETTKAADSKGDHVEDNYDQPPSKVKKDLAQKPKDPAAPDPKPTDKPAVTNGIHPTDPTSTNQEPTTTNDSPASKEPDTTHLNETSPEEPNQPTDQDPSQNEANEEDATPPPPPRRMTTRAQAQANSHSSTHPTPPLSPTLTTSTTPSSLSIHPLFLLPPTSAPNRDHGLPAQEAEETRRLLWSYVQKQEESVRGTEKMLDGLLKACRMRDLVLEWCKAEGHVGEMSDGEDWYDKEKWGLEEDLKKGSDEDDDAGGVGGGGGGEERTAGGKKTRRRGAA